MLIESKFSKPVLRAMARKIEEDDDFRPTALRIELVKKGVIRLATINRYGEDVGSYVQGSSQDIHVGVGGSITLNELKIPINMKINAD